MILNLVKKHLFLNIVNLLKMDMEQILVSVDLKHLKLSMSRLNVKFLVQKSEKSICLNTLITGEDLVRLQKKQKSDYSFAYRKCKKSFLIQHQIINTTTATTTTTTATATTTTATATNG